MPGRTFDAWLAFQDDYDAKRDVAGKYGIDFRAPEPSGAHRRTLRLLSELRNENPKMVKVNGEQFDYLDAAQSAPTSTQSTHNAPKLLSTNPFPTLTRPVAPTLYTHAQPRDLASARSHKDKDIDSPESDTTSATPRAPSEVGFEGQYPHQGPGSSSGYNVDDWMNPMPFQGLSSLNIHSPVTPVPPSPSAFSQASERSPLSAHAERPSTSFMVASQGGNIQGRSDERQYHGHLGGNNHTPLLSSPLNSAGIGSGIGGTGRARAPSAPTYPHPPPQLAITHSSFNTHHGGPMHADATYNASIAVSRQLQAEALRPAYARRPGSGPVFGTAAGAEVTASSMGTGSATAPPMLMQVHRETPPQTQVGAYGYRYPVATQLAYPSFTSSVPGPPSLPSLTSGSTASSSASISSGASAAGDATWARVSALPSSQGFAASTATGSESFLNESDDMEEDEDEMGGWGRMSDPLPLLPSTSNAESAYATTQQSYNEHGHGTPLGFPAPAQQQMLQQGDANLPTTFPTAGHWRSRGHT